MKKNQILAGIFHAGITLGACTEDYTDWLSPNPILPKRLPLNMKSISLQVPVQLWTWISFTARLKKASRTTESSSRVFTFTIFPSLNAALIVTPLIFMLFILIEATSEFDEERTAISTESVFCSSSAIVLM